mmetsp:Transcript_3231/g.6702  ORF Transcript_3231/g.6702 Transcript_3231/m.6702 type:complete len:341 (+) Transcript_3231:47-1069(+)
MAPIPSADQYVPYENYDKRVGDVFAQIPAPPSPSDASLRALRTKTQARNKFFDGNLADLEFRAARLADNLLTLRGCGNADTNVPTRHEIEKNLRQGWEVGARALADAACERAAVSGAAHARRVAAAEGTLDDAVRQWNLAAEAAREASAAMFGGPRAHRPTGTPGAGAPLPLPEIIRELGEAIREEADASSRRELAAQCGLDVTAGQVEVDLVSLRMDRERLFEAARDVEEREQEEVGKEDKKRREWMQGETDAVRKSIVHERRAREKADCRLLDEIMSTQDALQRIVVEGTVAAARGDAVLEAVACGLDPDDIEGVVARSPIFSERLGKVNFPQALALD